MDAPAIETTEFNPAGRLITIKGKGGDKPFLPAYDAIAWFWTEFPAPRGRIVPMILDAESSIVRAEIWVDDKLIAAADVKGDKSTSLEKLETSAVRRALAFAGYGTVGAMAHEDDHEEAASQARAAQAARDIPTETAREKLGSGKGRKIETRLGGLRKEIVAHFEHPYYGNEKHLLNAVDKLFEADIFYEGMTIKEASELLANLANYRANGLEPDKAIEEVRKLTAKAVHQEAT